ncbi:MAG: hypothetical protein JRN38_06420, partial [Nitrososphaerota archaeon]|nr:hypothetical protein [Nitrososphaerota archaeon]
MPKFSSPSIFAAILDRGKGGRWVIQPSATAISTQSYLEDTNILRTEFRNVTSRVVLTDFMPCSLTQEAWSAPPEIHRVVQCLSGTMQLKLEFNPVFNYGYVMPKFAATDFGVTVKSRKEEIALSSSIPFQVSGSGASAEFTLAQGEKRAFVLSYGEDEPRKVNEYHTERQRAKTEVF